jgi:hypothetical protein
VKESFGLVNPITVKVEDSLVTIKRAGKKVTLAMNEIKAVRHERRALRGHVLVVETYNKPLYFKQSEGACKDAMKFLTELVR